MRKEDLRFKISSGLKNIIGKELITNELVAVFELVKNSCDARASNIQIHINVNEDKIIISDNGKGMSYLDIKDKWLFVAYSEKMDAEEQFAGSKGIGRFSCDRLGAYLEIYSKTVDDRYTNKLTINWDDFEQDGKKEFHHLNTSYEEIDASEKIGENNSGTILVISKLRDNWNEHTVQKVEYALQKLINPFEKDIINIELSYTEQNAMYPIFNRQIKNHILKTLEEKTIHIECVVEHDTIDIILNDEEKKIYEISFENNSLLDKARFKVYFMGTKAKMNFTRIMGMRVKSYGSLFLYKNNFRIYPYGEVGFDGFSLNIRKTQGYNRYLGHREILGWININDDSNHFKEVSSRDGGFIENIYTHELQNFYMRYVHRPLEEYVTLSRYGLLNFDGIIDDNIGSMDKLLQRYKKEVIISQKVYESPKELIPLTVKLNRLSQEGVTEKEKVRLQKEVSKVIAEQQDELHKVKKKNEYLIQENANQSAEIANKNQFILEERPNRQAFLLHELNITSGLINAQIKKIKGKLPKEYWEKCETEFAQIRRNTQKLKAIQRLVLKVDIDTKTKVKMNLLEFIEEYVRSYGDDCNFELLFDNKQLIATVDNLFDFGVLLDNLMSNVSTISTNLNLSSKKIIFDADDNSFSVISKTGPISEENLTEIFNLGFTTVNGTGLGLYFIKQICDDFGWTVNVFNLKNDHVCFQFIVRESMDNEK